MVLPAVIFLTLFVCLHGASVRLPQIGEHNKINTALSTGSVQEGLQSSSFIRQIFPNKTEEVAGIRSSKLGFSQTSGITGGIIVPGQPGVTYSFSMKGSIEFVGVLKSDIQDVTENLITSYSSELQDWYKSETKSLKARAGGGFFSFFQAAANYGYTKNKATRNVLDSGEFQRFSDQASALLASVSTTTLRGEFDGQYSAVSIGVREVLSVFGFIYINQLTLDSGKVFNVVSKNPALYITDRNGNVRNNSTQIEMVPKGPSGLPTINTNIGG